MNHIARLPLVSRQSMSPLPSALKSSGGRHIAEAADEVTDAPFMNHIVSRQGMSPLPSPLKSAVELTDQAVGITPRPAVDVTVVPS